MMKKWHAIGDCFATADTGQLNDLVKNHGSCSEGDEESARQDEVCVTLYGQCYHLTTKCEALKESRVVKMKRICELCRRMTL